MAKMCLKPIEKSLSKYEKSTIWNGLINCGNSCAFTARIGKTNCTNNCIWSIEPQNKEIKLTISSDNQMILSTTTDTPIGNYKLIATSQAMLPALETFVNVKVN